MLPRPNTQPVTSISSTGNNPSSAGDKKEDTLSATYLKLCRTTVRDTLGQYGMLQHHFASKKNAETFVSWLKQQSCLKYLYISKANIVTQTIEGEEVYVVRISQAQFDAIMGKGEFAKIISQEAILALIKHGKDVLSSPHNMISWSSLVNDKDLAGNELNQKRFLFSDKEKLLIKLFETESKDDINLRLLANSISPNVMSLGFESTAIVSKILTSEALTTIFERALNESNLDPIIDTHGLLGSINKFPVTVNFIIENISNSALNSAVMLAFQRHPHQFRVLEENKFALIFNKLGQTSTNDLLKLVSSCCNIPFLHEICMYQTEKAFLSVVNAASAEGLGLAVNKLHATNNLLHLDYLGSRHSDHAYLTVITKISSAILGPDMLGEAIRQENSAKYNPLSFLARYRKEETVAKVIQLAPANALSAASMPNVNITTIYYLLQYCTAPTIVSFFSKIDDKALAQLLKPDATKPVATNYVAKIAEGLLNEKAWQNPTLITRLFRLMGQQLAPLCLRHWINGNDLSSQNYQETLKHITFITQDEETAFKKYIPIEWHINPVEQKEILSITTGADRVIRTDDHDNLKKLIWEEGLSDWPEYRRARQLQKNIHGLVTLLDKLYSSRRITLGFMVDFVSQPDEKQEQQLLSILKTTEEENTLIKIVKTENWDEFFNQLADYKFRPALRGPIDKKIPTHKFVHMTGKIITPYIAKKNKNKIHNATKKNSATLISKNINTSVFGEHDKNRNLVGLLFDMKKCIVKAMLTQDKGTFARDWVGSEQEVLNYAETMKEITYSDLNAFREITRKHPHKLNELLVKMTREAIMAVVIVTDNPETRAIAEARAKQLADKLNIHVPIVFYHRALRTFCLFEKLEEKNDAIITSNPSILIQQAMRPGKEFLGYLNTISFPVLIKALAFQAPKHSLSATVLHTAATYQKPKDFIKFLKLIGKKACKETYCKLDINGNSVLAIIAANQNSEALQLYLSYLSMLELDLLISTSTTANNLLHIVAKNQRSEGLLFIINVATHLSNMLIQENNLGETPLHLILKNPHLTIKEVLAIRQNSQNFSQALIGKTLVKMISPLQMMMEKYNDAEMQSILAPYTQSKAASLGDRLLITNAQGENLLQVGARLLSPSNFILLMKCTNEEVLNQLSQTDSVNAVGFWDTLIQHQSLPSILYYLSNIDELSIDHLFFSNNIKESHIAYLTDLFFTEKMPEELAIRLLSHFALGPILLDSCEKRWLDGHDLTKGINTYLLKHLKDKAGLTSTQQALLHSIPNNNIIIEEKSAREPGVLLSSKGTILDINSPDIVKTVWHEGVKSWQDYRELRKVQHKVDGLSSVLDKLHRLNSVLSGSYQSLPIYSIPKNISASLTTCINQGNALIKLTNDQEWSELVQQLFDYSEHRPADLKFLNTPAVKQYNFLEKTISPFKKPQEMKECKHTQATTARLISPALNTVVYSDKKVAVNTVVYSDNKVSMPQVGCLFDSNLCIIDAMLMRDGFLNNNNWIGSLADIEAYAKVIEKDNYVNFATFQQAVKDKPYQLNQVLVKLSREALLAIVIAQDTPMARTLASERAKTLYNILGIDVPVLFYNNVLCKLSTYSPEEMNEDNHTALKSPQDEEAKARMLALNEDIKSSALKRYSLFGSKAVLPATAQKISDLIAAAENNPLTSWSLFALDIKKRINDAITKVNKYRSVETQEFYEQELKKFF